MSPLPGEEDACMSKTRIERDSFGPIDVASGRLWGAQTQRSLEFFRISGERMPHELILALALTKKAAAAVNRDLGLLEKEPILVDGVSISPRSVFAAAAEPRFKFPGEPDLVVMRVQVQGLKSGRRREIVFEMLDRMDKKNGITAMMRTTAYPTTASALMIARGEVAFRGVAAMERAIPAEAFLREIARHQLKITVRERAIRKGAEPL